MGHYAEAVAKAKKAAGSERAKRIAKAQKPKKTKKKETPGDAE